MKDKPKLIDLRSVSDAVPLLNQEHGKGWSFYHGDCCEVMKGIPDSSIDFQIMSPPFASLFTYSNSERDLGNCRNDKEFYDHYAFVVEHQFRVAVPGKLCAIHVMQLPTTKSRDGFIGIRDFRGDCIRIFQKIGWIYHSEVCIWKDPVTAMQRTKALGLLHKQLKKDSSMSRQGIADYLLVFRKPGDNPRRVTHTNESFPVALWQHYASPVWASLEEKTDKDGFFHIKNVHNGDDGDNGGIDQGNTLQARSAREAKDERHMCPLQLGVIRRSLKLWSNPKDVVLSPFGGIASEGIVSVEMGRRYIGVELKKSYWKSGVANLKLAERSRKMKLLNE
jgi:DNA modification methylase